MESIALIGPPPRRLVTVQHPDTPTATELSVAARQAIERIDQAIGTRTVCACVACDAGLPVSHGDVPGLHPASTEHRSSPLDERPVVPIDTPRGGSSRSVTNQRST